MTPKQARRQESRNQRSGRYEKHKPCELCGLSAGEDYVSDPRCNDVLHGQGLVLHEKCAVVIGLLAPDVALAVLDASAKRDKPAGRSVLSLVLRAEAKTRAGCVDLHFCRRGTGPLVGIYRNAESWMESDPATPWSVVCEAHHTLVCVETRAAADSTSADTCNFCDDCRYGPAGPPYLGDG